MLKCQNSQLKRLVLISPVPEMRTGTGNYLGLLVRDLIHAGVGEILVVIDVEQLPESLQRLDSPALASRLFGSAAQNIHIVDYRQFWEQAGDLCVYFAANNEYHFYVYALLGRRRIARRWLLIHEPSCLMIAINYFNNKLGSGSGLQLLSHLQAQYGGAASALYEDIKSCGVVQSLLYESFGFDWFSFEAEKIIVHSEYARLKLLHELQSPHPSPQIVVRRHPEEASVHGAQSAQQGSVKELRFGVFGFVNPSKRVVEVISGLAQFVRSIGVRQARNIGLKLLVVGKLPNRQSYDPRGHARAEGVGDFVDFYDYVEKSEFVSLLQSCDTIFNLRFPSCGETTGLSAFKRPGLHIAVSDYHSFREVGADFLVAPGDDVAGVSGIMASRYESLFGSGASAAREMPIQIQRDKTACHADLEYVSDEIAGVMNVQEDIA